MITPSGHRVLVTPDKVEEKTAHGIILPSSTKEAREQTQIFGTVVSIGATAFKDFSEGEPWCEVGDRVAFAKYGGFIIKDPHTEEEFRLLNDEDICAVITE